MKSFLTTIVLLLVSTLAIYSQTVGDYRTLNSGNWTANTTWERFSGSVWAPAASGKYPGSTSSTDSAGVTTATILNGHTVTIDVSSKSIRHVVINAGGVLTTAGTFASPMYLRITGSVTNNGTINPDTSLGLGFQVYNAVTFTGSGTTNITRLRNTKIGSSTTIDCDMLVYYRSSTGTTGVGIYPEVDGTSFIINPGKTLTTGPGTNIATTTTTSTEPVSGFTWTWNINGTLNMNNGTNPGKLYLDNSAGKTTTVNINGTLNTGGVIVTRTSGTVAININNGGLWKMNHATNIYLADLSNTNTTFTINSGGEFKSGLGEINIGSGSISGAGTFTLENGGTLDILSATGLEPIAGPIRTTSRSFSTGANYSFTGTSAQVTGSDFPSTVAGLTVNNSSGLTLTNSTTVNGTLAMTNGNLSLGTNDITLSAVSGTLGATRHITTGSTGVVKSSIAESGTFTYPVGIDATSYNPVTIALAGGDPTETFSVRVGNSVNPSAPNNGTAVQRTWMISEGTTGSNNATITFQWTGLEEGGSFTRETSALWHHNGSSWMNVSGGTFGGTDPYTLTTTSAVTSFSPFIVGNDGALPVELTSFTAKATQRSAELSWNTASEINNHGFEIERRVITIAEGKGLLWNKAGFVSGAGNSNSPKPYSFVDANLAAGRYEYRLKQIDNDGGFKYVGSIEAVEIGVAAKVFGLSDNYPNPFNPSTSIEFTVAKEGLTTLKVYNMIGQEVASLYNGIAQAGKINRVQFDAKQLPSGIYFSKLQFGNQQLIKKMMLVK